jgi:alpha-mannosidase
MKTRIPQVLPGNIRGSTSRSALVSAATLLLLFSSGGAVTGLGVSLWQIGQPDHDDREFALAPNRYGEFRQDAFYVIGQSDPKRDWPYVQPGPVDGWAGGKPHTFTIEFGLKSPPGAGDCTLQMDLVDTHSQASPNLRVTLNDHVIQRQLTPGAGDASVFGDPSKGKNQTVRFRWDTGALKTGGNEITITTLSGSWLLYDSIGFETPAGAELTEVSGTRLSSIKSQPVLVNRNGRSAQVIEVSLVHFGAEVEATVGVAGSQQVKRTLRAGPQMIEVTVPAVDRPTELPVSVEVSGQSIAGQTITLNPVRKWVVYLLPHSHVDIGYTHVQTDVERAQWKYLEMGIDTARRTASNPPGARFKWNVEVLWAVDSYLKQASPEKQEQFLQAVRAGWVGLQALYGNELTGLCRPEELLRLVGFAQTLAQRVGQPIESAMITDVPGYTWGVVPTFAHTGIKYFSIGPNGGDRIGYTIAAWGDKPFWWVGPNGLDKVLVWMTGTGYYQVFQSPDKLLGYLEQLEAKAYPYDFVQVRHCLGDNGAPDVNFADKVKEWNETHAYPRLVIATSEEMFRDFERRYGDKIPTAQGDFTPYWEDGAASSARETALNRASADRLTQAQTLFAMLNSKAYPAGPFYQAWRNVVLYDEHTWGAHNSISQPDHPFAKSQWAIKQAFALDADTQSHQLLQAGLDLRQGTSAPNAIDVINTTAMDDPLALVRVPKDLSGAGDVIQTALGGDSAIPAQRLTSGELVFQAHIPPFSTARFYVRPGTSSTTRSDAVTAETTALEGARNAHSPNLTLRVDEKTGAITSLRYGTRELVNAQAGTGLNDYFYLPGSDLKGLQRNGPVRVSIKERGPLIASLLIESDAPGCRKLTREIRLHAPLNYVEIINTVDKEPVRTKEGVHFGFGFNVPDATVRMDVPWGVVRPETDQIPGACKNWFTVQRWVDISNKDYGVTWATPDAPLVEVGGITANLIGSLSDPKVWMDHIQPSATIYSWAMNNHWHTNYRADQEGPTVFRYFIFPHEQFNQNQAAIRGLQCSQPLIVAPARGEVPKTPPLRISNPNVMVSAFKPSEDGKAVVVRLFGASGQNEKVELTWPDRAPAATWLSNGSERALRQVNGPIDVPAYTIVTVRAELR